MALKALKRLISGRKVTPAKKVIKKTITKKKPSTVKTRVLTAEGWKRRFGLKPLKAKKTTKR